MSTISIFKLDSPGSSCQGHQLMAKADSHYWYLRGFHDFAKMVNGILAMSGISRAVADEDAIKAKPLCQKDVVSIWETNRP